MAVPHKLTETERAELKKGVEPIWNQYINLPLTISVGDEPIRRLCQVLTNNGYVTFSSCEGHGKDKPYICFRCKSTSAVAGLSYILDKTAIANFIWEIKVHSQTGMNDNRFRAYYTINPEESRRESLDIVKDKKQLIEDFDILGYSILDYFLNR